MYDKKLAHKIRKFLENTNQSYKIKEIAKEIHVGKHNYKNLVHTLRMLVMEKKIKLKNRKYKASKEIHKIVTGKFDATAMAKNKTFAFVNTDDFDIFISAENTLNAYHNDIVEVDILYNRRGKRYGKITRIIERNTTIFVGKVENYHGKHYLIPDNSRIHNDFSIKKLKEAKPGEKVVLKIFNWGDSDKFEIPQGDVQEILGKAGNPDVEILSVIKQYDLPLEFPHEVLNELDSLSVEISEQEITKRTDLRKLLTFTIDPESAKDFDDAVSLISQNNQTILYVHIADVAHYVKPKNSLFAEAVKRGNSYYFPKKVIPMLPEKISNKLCSLRPFENKLTLTIETTFDSNFKIISQKSYESVMKSNARFNYKEIDAFFADEKTDIEPEIQITLSKMKALSKALSERRKKAGYLFFNLPETEFIFDEAGHIIDLQRSKETASHKLIENFMLIANEFVAKKLGSTIYRIHEKPTTEKLDELKEKLSSYKIDFNQENSPNLAIQKVLQNLPNDNYHRVFDKMILRSMMKAKYSTNSLGHFGLALKNYTHFTSPIRRLCDLVVHHQLKNLLGSQNINISDKDLHKWAKIATEREAIADDSERDVEIKNKLIFMRKKLGEEYDAIIIGLKNNAIIVELDKIPITGLIQISSLKDDYYSLYRNSLIGKKNGKIYKLTDSIKIFVSKVDDDIYFQLVN